MIAPRFAKWGPVASAAVVLIPELRIHGVSGTLPRDMLDTDPIPRDPEGWTRVFLRPGHRDSVEAFRWGGMTSGSAATAFWLLLLPFALANTAGWMAAPRAWRTPYVAVVRLACLMLTGIFVLEAVTVTVDLPWHRLEGLTLTVDPRWIGAGLMVASLLIIVVLTLVSGRSHFEERMSPARRIWSPSPSALLTKGEVSQDRTVEPTSPSDPAMWDQPATANRLARLHVSFGITLIGTVAATAAVGGVQHLPGTYTGLVNLGVLALIILATALAQTATGSGIVDRLIAWLPIFSLMAFIGGVASFLLSDLRPARHLPGLHDLAFTVVVALGGLVLLAFLVGFSSRPAALLVIAGIAGGGLGAGLALAVERGLQIEGALPNGFGWFAASSLFAFLLITLILAIRFAWVARRSLPMQALRDTVPAMETAFNVLVVALTGLVVLIVAYRWPDVFERALPSIDQPPFTPWLGYVATGVFVLIVGLVVGAFVIMRQRGLAIAALGAGALTLVIARFGVPGTSVFGIPLDLGTFPSVAAAAAILLPASFIMTRIVGGLRNESKRRAVGIIWDLAGLWPRWYHPFAPPPYGPKVVVDLRTEVEGRLSDGGKLVLAAHSQGSVLAAVVVRQLSGDSRSRLGFLTYGSPLQRLYGWLFPAHLTPDWVAGLRSELSGPKGLRWRNLYRRTDPIGGSIDEVPGEGPIEDVDNSHGGYEQEPEYGLARDAVWGLLALPQ